MSELVTRLKIEDVLIVIIGMNNTPINTLQLSLTTHDVVICNDGLEEHCVYRPGIHSPTSDVVNQALEQLEKDGMITIGEKMALTERGRELQKEILEPKDGHVTEFSKPINKYGTDTTLSFIGEVKEAWLELDADELCILSHCKYPEFVLESDTCKKLKLRAEEILIKMAKDAKISIGLFARFMGLGYEEGYELLQKNDY